jgi:hypothetical protein
LRWMRSSAVIKFQRRPGKERRLGHIGIYWLVEMRHQPFVVNGVRDHSIFALVIEQDTQLILGEFGIHVAVRQRVKKGIPLPHPDIMNERWHHRFAREIKTLTE